MFHRQNPFLMLFAAGMMTLVVCLSNANPAFSEVYDTEYDSNLDFWSVYAGDGVATATAVYDPYDRNQSRYISNNSSTCVGSETPGQYDSYQFNMYCNLCHNSGAFVSWIYFLLTEIPEIIPSPQDWNLW